MFDRGVIPVLERMLQFTELRHRVIANNIANVSTPHYQAQDLPAREFSALLQRSIERQRERNVPVFRLESGFDFRERPDGSLEATRMEFPTTGVLRHDENNVSVDLEMAKLGKNAILQETVLQLLRHNFDGIARAISGRVGG